MSRSDRSTQRWFLAIAAIFVAAGACTDTSQLTPPTAASAAASPGGGGGGGGGGGQRRLSIVAINLSGSSLTIGGPNVGYTVTVENKGSDVSGVTLQGAIVQGAVSHPAGGFAANCPPNPTGVVPKGSCQMTFTTSASNANGVGALVPGAASFVLTMSLAAGSVSAVVDQQSVPVTLVASTQTITSLTLSKTTLAIADPTTLQADFASLTAVIQNTGSALSNVRIQADFVQGTVIHNSGGLALACTSPQNGDGILPNGTCTMNWSAVASNAPGSGSGTLTPGAATFVLKLIQDVNGTATVLDSKSVPVTLTGGTVAITNLALNTTTLAIGGANVPYDVTIFNSTSQLSNVFIQGEIVQNGNVAGAAGSNLLCPPTSANAVLPVGTCTMSWSAAASNQSYSPAPLVPGAATFRLTLYQGFGSPVVLDTKSVAVTLVAGPPEITSVIFFDPSNNVLLSTTVGTDYNVTLVNSGTAMTGLTLQSRVVQTLNGVTSTRIVSNVPLACPNDASGTLPNGVCTFQVTAIVSNNGAGGGPDLVPENDATYVVMLLQNGVQVATTSRVVHLKVQLF